MAPESLRSLFEEAAGISRYKLQKKEAEKKLQQTAENLARINDLIREIEREKDIKFRQSEKTREYLSFRTRYINLDVKLNFIKYIESDTKREKLNYSIEAFKKEREDISARISRISAENEKDEKLKNDIQVELFEFDKELHEYHIKSQDIDGKTEKNRNLMKEEYKLCFLLKQRL